MGMLGMLEEEFNNMMLEIYCDGDVGEKDESSAENWLLGIRQGKMGRDGEYMAGVECWGELGSKES